MPFLAKYFQSLEQFEALSYNNVIQQDLQRQFQDSKPSAFLVNNKEIKILLPTPDPFS